MDADTDTLPATRGTAPDAVAPTTVCRDLVRCGAELVELSERFYRGIFCGCIIFVGVAGAAALAFLPLRQSDASYGTITVAVTALLAVLAPIAVRRAGALYRMLRRHPEAEIAPVLLAAALIVHPLRSELWWPSCALLMLVATLAPLRRTLAYCLVVLLANLAAHLVADDLDDTAPVTIIGLWIGYVFWSSAFSVFTDRLAAHVLRLNTPPRPQHRPPPLRVGTVGAHPAPGGARPDRDPPDEGAALARAPAGNAVRGLTARQLQVVALLADGLRYDEVAACLAISVRQVQRHVTNATARLGLRTANELVAVAVAEHLVPTGRVGGA